MRAPPPVPDARAGDRAPAPRGDGPAARRGWGFRLAWIAVLGAGIAARLASWGHVFTGGGVQLVADTDPHYHVLRARQLLDAYPRIPLTDPLIDHPFGARILWPPLFDLLSAWPCAWLGRPDLLEPIAAMLPVVFGALTLPLVYVIGRMVGSRRAALLAMLVLALLPAHLEFTILGRADQHAAEIFFATWVSGAFLWALQGASSARMAWLQRLAVGSGIALAAWNWQGSALNVAVLAGFVATVHLARGGERSSVAAAAVRDGAVVAAVLLLGSMVALQPGAVRDFSAKGLTGFHVTVVAMAAGGAALLARLAARGSGSGPRRMGEVVLAGVVPLAAAAALVPQFAGSVGFALSHVAGKTPWLASIDEFSPILFSGSYPLSREVRTVLERFGLALLAMPACGVAIWRARRASPERRPRIDFLLFWGAIFAVLAAATARFSLYVSVPAALWIGIALDRMAARIDSSSSGRHAPLGVAAAVAGVAIVLAPGAQALTPGWYAPNRTAQETIPLARWLRQQAPEPGREGVLASWVLGHALRYHAGKPVVATPFGTDGGERAMEDTAEFFAARSSQGLEAVVDRRRIGWVVLLNPLNDVALAEETVGARQRAMRIVPDRVHGNTLDVDLRALSTNAAARLYFADGASFGPGDAGAAGRLRLLYETQSVGSDLEQDNLKAFGVVTGAVVEVRTRPAAEVHAEVSLRTNAGRDARWVSHARADASGRAALRIPYQAGWNGASWAKPAVVSDGTRQRVVAISAADVAEGRAIPVDLGP